MSQIALVNQQLIINNIAIDYVPNTLDFDLGLGEQSVKALAGGGGVVDSVYFQNVESNVSIVKFEKFSTDIMVTLAQDWKALGNANVIQIQGEGSIITFQFMALTNRVDVMTGNEKQTSFEFQGSPAITT